MFDMKDLNPAQRCYFDESKEEYVDLKIASDSDINKMRKEAGISQKIEYLKNTKTGRQERSDYLDTNEENMGKLNELSSDFAIYAWKIFDQDKNEIPLTLENKKILMGESVKFSRFVADNLDQIRKDQEDELKTVVKN